MSYGLRMCNHKKNEDTMNRQRSIRHYHALCRSLGLDGEARKEMLHSSFGVSSCSELSDADLQLLVSRLVAIDQQRASQAQRYAPTTDRWRKRVIACLCGYLQVRGYPVSVPAAIAVAERASGKAFAELSQKELAKVYNAFKNEPNRITKSSK